MTPSIPTVIKVRLATKNNVLESFKLEAEGACRCRGEKPFAKILFSTKSIIKVLDDKVKNIFRNLFLNLGPETILLIMLMIIIFLNFI